MGAGKNRRVQDKNGVLGDPMSVTWTEKYSDNIESAWQKVPPSLGKLLATAAIFAVGISINGNWLSILVHVSRQFGYGSRRAADEDGEEISMAAQQWSEISLESLRLQNVWTFLFFSCFISYGMYFFIGGFLHWYFYVRQRDRAEEWKCQPKKWLSPELERHEIALGSLTLFVNAVSSGLLACYIANGGYSTVYYDFSEFGWLWLCLQIPAVFIYQDYMTYWMHRIYHIPILYKHFHKLHHKYKQPTAFSVTAIHPFESFTIQCMALLPLFTVPIHWMPFYAIELYVYYHGIIDHSGINFKAYWWQPWQPDAIFHDNHHQYFHVNFAFNMSVWDKLHGTYRLKDRVYTEDIFYGKGKKLDEVSAAELKADLEEREAENPLAYRDNKMEFKLSKTDLEKIQKSTKKRKATKS